jgi:carbonic anhydrase/acetyltransferase-like protein (isoleucine patch superfamily)
MRYLLIIASALLALGATLTFTSIEANAAVCADGVVRAGCAGPRGAVVVRKPVKVCKTVWVNGVKVRRCT